MKVLRYHRLVSASDHRGDSFHIPKSVFEFMGAIEEMHFVTIMPGAVRGNHYHRGRKEFMFVNYDGPWMLAWRLPGARSTHIEEFDGRGGMIVEIASDTVHAIKNKGIAILHIVSCSDAPYIEADTESMVILD